MLNNASAQVSAGKKRVRKHSQGYEVWTRLCHRPVAVASMLGCAFILFLAVFANVLAPYEDAIKQVAANKLLPPFSPGHLLGTDNFGRDILARIIHGARTAMEIGLIATVASLIISTVLACLGSMLGGWADMVIMRFIDVISCVPGMVVALAICAALGNGIPQLLVALTVSGLPMHTRMIRSVALGVSKMDYVESAVALGGSPGYIMWRHLCPNLASVIIVNGTTQVSINIMQGATLGFIGLGVKEPTPEWGTMLSNGLTYMMANPHMVLIPGIVLCLSALCINTFGDCLRDAFDPQLKGKS